MEYGALKKYCEEKNIALSDIMIGQFDQFCHALIEKNKVMNLTAIDDPHEIEIKHFIDSLECASALRELGATDFSLLDIGCGAGFPGIPLKIVFPENRFVLLDSLNKRINFVNEVIDQLNLQNVSAVASRAEDFSEKEGFDFCVSRAVARMNVLLEYCLPFVKVGGYCILLKSGEYETELEEAANAIQILGGQLIRVDRSVLPENSGDRSLVIIKKITSTPSKYPRRAGKPSKSPL